MRQRCWPLLLPALLCLASSLLFAQSVPAKGQDDREAARQRIGITIQQQKDVESLFASADQQRQAATTRLHTLYHELRDLYDSYELDQRQERAIRDQIVVQHRLLLAIHADSEAKLRHILTRDQFERLRDQMKEEREKHRRSQFKGDNTVQTGPGRHPDPQ